MRSSRTWDRGSFHHGRDRTSNQPVPEPGIERANRRAPPRALGRRHRRRRDPLALKRASERVDAELCVYVDGELTESTSSEASLVVPVHGRLHGNLILARTDREFDSAEREQIQSVARALSLFQPSLGPELLDRLALQDELGVALRRNEIHTYFLPKVDLRTARIIGVEALARWFHPERGVLQPADFLGLAEAGGLLRVLTEQIIQLATRAAGDWWRSGLRLELSVNLPADILAEPDPHFEKLVTTALSQSGLPAESLRFDVTEDALMTVADPSEAIERLTAPRRLDLDRRLRDRPHLPQPPQARHRRRGSRSIVPSSAPWGGRRQGMVRSTIHLARQMGLRIVAEGVDTDDRWRHFAAWAATRRRAS